MENPTANKAELKMHKQLDNSAGTISATTTTTTVANNSPTMAAAAVTTTTSPTTANKDAKDVVSIAIEDNNSCNNNNGNPKITQTEQNYKKEISTDKQNMEIPIISLSDGEDVMTTATTTTATKGMKKRKSMESSDVLDEHLSLKRRKIKVAGAPKMPLTGYVRYMNDRRELLRKEYPNKTAMDITKMIGEEWQTLSEELKTPYKKAAEVDKQRYISELNNFLKERPDVLACELAKTKQRRPSQVQVAEVNKAVLKEKTQSNVNNAGNNNVKSTKDSPLKDEKMRRNSEQESVHNATSALVNSQMNAAMLADKSKRKRTPTPPTTASGAHTTNGNIGASAVQFSAPVPGEIPIFTNEFLEHNKVIDMELRTLRKSKADLEQQNAVLEKHVENMKFGVEKMTNENDELQEKNRLLEVYLDKLKRKLAQALAGLSIPTEPNGATLDNIDKYMNDLYKMATTNTHGPASLNKAKDIIRKLDLQIQL